MAKNKIKILFLATNSTNIAPLRLDRESREIAESLRMSAGRDAIEYINIWATRPDDLLRSIFTHNPQVVHFASGGTQTGEISFLDPDGNAKIVSSAALKALFGTFRDSIRLVILDPGYSQMQAEAIASEIDCVIAMSQGMNDKEVITFISAFYHALAFGQAVDMAYKLGLSAIQLEGLSESNPPYMLVREGANPSKIYIETQSSLKSTPDEENRISIELKLQADFTDLSPEDRSALLNAISSLLGISKGDVRILDIKEGSFVVKAALPEDAAAKLKRLHKAGIPIMLDIGDEQEATVIEINLVAPPPITRVLFLTSNPTDATRLRLDEEIREIDQAIWQSAYRDRFDLRQQRAVRVRDLQSHLLRYKPNVVHFSGHASRFSEIILEDSSGQSHPVSVDSLSRLFTILHDNIDCVILNACYSEKQAKAIAEHIDCVIGMSDAIGDAAAIRFAAAFYQAAGYKKDVKTSFDLACTEIDMEKLDEQNIPRLIAERCDPTKIFLVKEV